MSDMQPDEVFQLSILSLAEAICNIIKQRASGNGARKFRLYQMQLAINQVASTYKGTLPDDFITRSDAFNQRVETHLTELLAGFKGGQ